MSKHNDKAFINHLKDKFREGYEKQYRSGLHQGMFAALSVVRSKAQAEGKTTEEKLSDVLAFCNVLLRDYDKKKEGASNADADQDSESTDTSESV